MSLTFPQIVYAPYGQFRFLDIKEHFKKNYLTNPDPSFIDGWLVGSSAVSLLYTGFKENNKVYLKNGLKIVDSLLVYFKSNKGFPHPAYKKFPNGWVSSMDAPTVALAVQMAYDITGDQKYKDAINPLIEYILKPTQDGGFRLNIEDTEGTRTWLSGYASKDTNKGNELYVLNGFLVGLQGTLMLAKIYNDDRLMELYESSLKEYQRISARFAYPDRKWAYYMLNPLTINQPHYIIFEIKLLAALHELDKNKFYADELDMHRLAIGSSLPIFVEPDESDSKKIRFYFWRACAPHPYEVDIYPSKLEFINSNAEVVSSAFSRKRPSSIAKNAYMNGKIPKSAVFAKIFSNTDGNYYFVCSVPLRPVTSSSILRHGYTIDTNFDCRYIKTKNSRARCVAIDRKINPKDEARIDFKLEKPIRLGDYFAIEVGSSQKANLMLVIYDEHGNSAFRYYPAIIAGSSLIFCHSLGFEDYALLKGDIVRIAIRIFTETSINQANNFKNFDVNFFDILSFGDAKGLGSYFKRSIFQVVKP